MELTNEFDVSVPVDEAWKVLTDLERIAPCLPGAQLQEVEGDEYRGVVKVKVGPITAQYKGKATFVVLDDAAHVAELSATGRDTRGQGTASASIKATLTPNGDGSHVSVLTDLSVTGKVAQFGRGVLADVSAKLMDQFVENLETTVLADGAAAERSAPSGTEGASGPTAGMGATGDVATLGEGPTVRTIVAPEAEPVDLLDTAGTPVLKRLLPALGAVIAVLAFGYLWRRRRAKSAAS
jgi:uncharacterized protein